MMDERTNERTYGRVDKEISGFYFHPRGTNFSKGLPPFVHPLLRPPSFFDEGRSSKKGR